MSLARIHEQTRTVLQARIDRGVVSISLLSRLTGIGQPHLSNYLHGRRRLSVLALSKVLDSLGFELHAVHRSSLGLGRVERSGYKEL